MRRKILPFILGGALAVASVAPAAATHTTAVAAPGGLVNVVVQAVLNNVNLLTNSEVNIITVDIDDSLNNALQNVLRNARILNNLEVTIENVLNDLDINVEDVTITVLENGDIQVNLLSGGVLVDQIVIG